MATFKEQLKRTRIMAPPLPTNYSKQMKTLSEELCLLSGIRLGNAINNADMAPIYYDHDPYEDRR